MGAGFFLVGCIVSAALHRRRSVRRQDVFEGLPSIYTEKILVCHDLSSDVCAGAASECRGPCYEPAPARGVSCSFFIIYIALQNLCFWERFTATDSYDPLFFAYLYMIAAYFRRYPARRTRGQYLLGYCAVCLFAAAWKLAMEWITNRVAGKTMGENMFLSYSSVTMVVASACLFRFLKGCTFRAKSFGVLRRCCPRSPLACI